MPERLITPPTEGTQAPSPWGIAAPPAVPPPVFVAYPAKLDAGSRTYRDEIVSLEKDIYVRFRFLDDNQSASNLTHKVRTQLKNCGRAIFDLTEANPNVCYELGLAVEAYDGDLEKVILMFNNATQGTVISDVEGTYQIRYATYSGMKVSLARELRRHYWGITEIARRTANPRAMTAPQWP